MFPVKSPPDGAPCCTNGPRSTYLVGEMGNPTSFIQHSSVVERLFVEQAVLGSIPNAGAIWLVLVAQLDRATSF